MNKLKFIDEEKIVFIKYIISSGISFVVDMILFSIFSNILMGYINETAILVATVLARIISSVLNYLMNKNKVFNASKDGEVIDKESFIKYFALVIIQMCISAGSVFVLFKVLKINQTAIKFVVDVFIFIANYFIQKLFIFKK